MEVGFFHTQETLLVSVIKVIHGQIWRCKYLSMVGACEGPQKSFIFASRQMPACGIDLQELCHIRVCDGWSMDFLDQTTSFVFLFSLNLLLQISRLSEWLTDFVLAGKFLLFFEILGSRSSAVGYNVLYILEFFFSDSQDKLGLSLHSSDEFLIFPGIYFWMSI